MTYERGTALEYFLQIKRPEDFRYSKGNFLDDFRYANDTERIRMVRETIPPEQMNEDQQKYAAFFAAMVEHVCYHTGIEIPSWTHHEIFFLSEPWFTRNSWRLRAWQLVTTPPAFKRRNIFCGDNALERV